MSHLGLLLLFPIDSEYEYIRTPGNWNKVVELKIFNNYLE